MVSFFLTAPLPTLESKADITNVTRQHVFRPDYGRPTIEPWYGRQPDFSSSF
jgi:hypothetical protein